MRDFNQPQHKREFLSNTRHSKLGYFWDQEEAVVQVKGKGLQPASTKHPATFDRIPAWDKHLSKPPLPL